jgi:hypothetical protein
MMAPFFQNQLRAHEEAAPVTLPRLIFKEPDIEREAKEAAARVTERKVIRAGVDAWQAIGKAESFENWKSIGAALAIGKAHALRVTGANLAWGQNYSRAFCDWMREHHFDRMPKSVRSVSIELHENADAITAWRATLSDKQRRRLVHPLSNVRRWRTATQGKTARAGDRVKAAGAAWRRFVTLMEALPPDQAAPFWWNVYEQAAAVIVSA